MGLFCVDRRWGNLEASKMEYYRGFLNALTNASLHNLHEFEKFGNDTTLDKITDLEDLGRAVRTSTYVAVRAEVVSTLLLTREVLGSNISPQTGYSDGSIRGFLHFLQTNVGTIRNITPRPLPTTSLPVSY